MPRRSNVFLCIAASARYRGSGSTKPKGLTVSRKAAFPQVWQNSDVDAYRTPPFSSKTPPLSALSRGRGGHCAFANFTDLLTIDRYNSSCFPRRILPHSEIMQIAFSSAKFCQSKRKNVPLQTITKLSRHEKNFFVLISHRAFGILQ